jgi:hypothetical protein
MFAKPVDLRKKQDMLTFLREHFKYDTRNSRNASVSYAHNVKLWTLVPRTLFDKALSVKDDWFELYYYELKLEFEQNTNNNYTIGVNGRSNGYLVLYTLSDHRSAMFFDPADDDPASLSDLRSMCRTVIAFDKMCDKMRDSFLAFVENSDDKK